MNNNSHSNRVDDEPVIGISPEAKWLSSTVKKLSRTNLPILIVGERGSGKKFIAQKIFNLSTSYNKALIRIDCAALGKTINLKDLYGVIVEDNRSIKGLLEQAHEGTLLLKNLDAMNYEYQREFLRILIDNNIRQLGSTRSTKIDMKIVSTADGDLLSKVDKGQFMKELFFRLNAIMLTVAPLKNRKQDIPAFFSYFQKQISQQAGFELASLSKEVFDSVLAYHWPGNVAELKSVVYKLVTAPVHGELSPDLLPVRLVKDPFAFFEPERFKFIIKDVEEFLIKKALLKFNGNQVKAAKLLGVPEATLRFKMKKYAFVKKNNQYE